MIQNCLIRREMAKKNNYTNYSIYLRIYHYLFAQRTFKIMNSKEFLSVCIYVSYAYIAGMWVRFDHMRIRIRYVNPDPQTQMNADRSGSTFLIYWLFFLLFLDLFGFKYQKIISIGIYVCKRKNSICFY